MTTVRPRIGLVSVYFGLFDQSMPPSFRQDRLDHAHRIADLLGRFGEVVFPGLVDSEESGAEAGRAIAAGDVDLLVCAPSMAAPPSYAWTALAAVPDVPVVVIAAQESSTVPNDYDTQEATRRSLPVGTVMLTNVLVRRGRKFTTLIGALGDPEFEAEIEATAQGIAAVARLRRGKLLTVGTPIGGYWDVEASPEELASLGVTVEEADKAALTEAFAEASAEDVASEVSAASTRFETEAVPADVLERSARLSVALRRMCGDPIVGGAVNCHSDLFRFNEAIGITACLAVTTLTGEGKPFACTGDVPTGIALLLGRTISDWALYCELYQVDIEGDWLLVANGGEGDPEAVAPGTTPCLLPEDHYRGERGAGTAIAFPIEQGSATLISLTPVSGEEWVMVAAPGEIIDARHEQMEGPQGMFRFDSGPAEAGFGRWCDAGATHHAALIRGHKPRQLEAVASALEIDLTVV